MYRIPGYFILLFAVLTLGCGGKEGAPSGVVGGSGQGTGGSDGNTTGSYAARDAKPGGNYLDVNAFPQGDIVSGGVGKDQIPSLNQPRFVDPDSPEAFYIRPDDLVLGVVINGEAKAYPHNIGWHHEIINDEVGGHRIVVSLCPLTGTGMVFDGEQENGNLVAMGVSGLLFNNNLIMYNKTDDASLYPQMTGRAISGPQKGESLKLVPVIETTWDYWRMLYPDSKVVSGVTGIYDISQYTNYPYQSQGDYRYESNYILFPMAPTSDVTPYFGRKQVTLGVRFGEIAKAYPFPAMAKEAVINDEVAGTKLVVVFYELHKLAIPYSRDVTVSGEPLSLTFDKIASDDDTYPFLLRDKETGSVWNLKGVAIGGDLEGQRLTQIPAHNAFWFAWTTFWRNTGVY
jgi:hypothetical protein